MRSVRRGDVDRRKDLTERKRTLYGATARLSESVNEQLIQTARSGVFWTEVEGLSTTQANRIREKK